MHLSEESAGLPLSPGNSWMPIPFAAFVSRLVKIAQRDDWERIKD